jgi:cytochrome P450
MSVVTEKLSPSAKPPGRLLVPSIAPGTVAPVEVSPAKLPHPSGPANVNRWIGLTWRHAAEFWLSPLQYITKLGHRYGDLCSFMLFTQRAYVVNSPELIHEYLVRRRDDYIRAPWEMRVLRQLVGNGILTSEGDLWTRQRRIIQQAFRGALLPRYSEVTPTTTQDRVSGWESAGEVDLVNEMAALMMDISIRTTTGINPEVIGGPTPEQLSDAIIEGADQMSREMGIPITPPKWLPLPSSRRKRRAIEAIDAYVHRAIEIRRADPDAYHDLLAVLLRAVDEEGDGKGMSDQQARDETATILIASAHSMSSTLGWFWKLVLARPELYDRLTEEVDLVLGDREPTFADLPKLEYLTQTLKETMRLFPPAYVLFARMPIRDTQLGGYRVCRGGWMITMPWVTHRDPRFFPEPMKFDPDRFSPEREGDIPKGAYFPFGHGPRICIGQQLAMVQLPLIVATMIQRFRFEPQPGFDDMTTHRELAVRPAAPCKVKVNRRDALPPRKPR